MEVVEINLIDSEAFQRCITSLFNVLWGTADSSVFAAVEFITKFSAEEDFVSAACFFEPFPEHLYYQLPPLQKWIAPKKEVGWEWWESEG